MVWSTLMTVYTFAYTMVRVNGFKMEVCRATALSNETNQSGFRFECKSDTSTKICKISEKFPDGSIIYCSFNKTYINEDWIQGFNLVKSECSGDKDHRFLLRIEHGEILNDNNCILDVKNVDISVISRWKIEMVNEKGLSIFHQFTGTDIVKYENLEGNFGRVDDDASLHGIISGVFISLLVLIVLVVVFIMKRKPELCRHTKFVSQNLDCNRCNIEVLTERQTPEGNAEEWYTNENCSNLDEDFDNHLNFTLNVNVSNIDLHGYEDNIIQNPYYGIEIYGDRLNDTFNDTQSSPCVMIDDNNISRVKIPNES